MRIVFTLMNLFVLLVVPFISGVSQVFCSIQANNDFFHGFYDGVFQRMANENGRTWDLKTNLQRLDVLANDDLSREAAEKTCIQNVGSATEQSTGDESSTKISFEDVAEVSEISFRLSGRT